MRLFYLGYPDLLQIRHAVRDEFAEAGLAALIETALRLPQELADPGRDDGWKPGRLHSRLTWTHYRTLLKVESRTARDFYEIEAVKNGWSARQLERQVHTLLFERLLKSRDREGLLALANEGQVIAEPTDVIKDPYVLEFLGLPASHRLAETELESALLSQLQSFLLKLGSGFAFVGRQLRLTLDGDHFYPDLVFYHVKLKCYVIIDLKITKLSHADLGQMQLYVNYYDREIAEPVDNPTIGLILCTDKNEAVVRYVLDEKRKQIFASRYQLHLPTEEQLRAELRREIERVDVPARSGEENV
jgi:predicted nuclease of restriction endonuclease-like (RecB) superfamily